MKGKKEDKELWQVLKPFPDSCLLMEKELK